MRSTSQPAITQMPIVMLEYLVYLSLAAANIFLLTYEPNPSGSSILASFGILAIALIWALYSIASNSNSQPSLMWPIIGLLYALWAFTFLDYLDFVTWPLESTSSVRRHVYLMYSNIVFSAITILALLCTVGPETLRESVKWGIWGRAHNTHTLVTVIIYIVGLAAIACGPVYFAVKLDSSSVEPSSTGILFIIISIKAFLISGTEELCNRGVLQRIAIARFGNFWGLLFQASTYTLFHMNIVSTPGVLAFLFFLGLFLGAITYVTRGIGAAFLVHYSLDFFVEGQLLL